MDAQNYELVSRSHYRGYAILLHRNSDGYYYSIEQDGNILDYTPVLLNPEEAHKAVITMIEVNYEKYEQQMKI